MAEQETKENSDFPVPVACRPKLTGWEFYEKVLGSPRLVVAPMVDQSELAWRLLSRNHGAQLCYTPMFHANIFTQDPKYRLQALQSCPADRPLIIQFCGNEPKVLLDAALLAQDHCDAVDLNLGCPQAIAKRGHYGAFLQDEWELLESIVSTLHANLAVPVTCKIRVFEDVEKTVRYAQMLERAGCQLLTVHGRTRDQKGPLTGLADWSYIRRVRESISIPMFANGNILSMEDINRCIEATGVQGVMTAEGNLHNPAIFEDVIPTSWDMANEYLNLVELYPCPTAYIRGHLFKMFHHLLNLDRNSDLREAIATAHKLSDFREAVHQLQTRFQSYHDGVDRFEETPLCASFDVKFPPWMCQPYIRVEPEEHKRVLAEKFQRSEDPQRERTIYLDDEGNQISRKLSKKLKRVVRRPNYVRGSLRREKAMQLCTNVVKCGNPVGLRCDLVLCRLCCRSKCYANRLQCVGHKFLLDKKRSRAKGLDVEGEGEAIIEVDG